MRSLRLVLIAILFFVIGCATVRVQAPKEPIRVDISMRLDVYQHVMSDIDAIEDIVTGKSESGLPGDDQSMLDIFVGTAYAQDLDSTIQAAALRRKGRYGSLSSLLASGVLGESSMGLVVIRGSADTAARRVADGENNDRMAIYKGIATKNGTSIADVQKVYAKRLQGRAPSGTPIERSSGNWSTK